LKPSCLNQRFFEKKLQKALLLIKKQKSGVFNAVFCLEKSNFVVDNIR